MNEEDGTRMFDERMTWSRFVVALEAVTLRGLIDALDHNATQLGEHIRSTVDATEYSMQRAAGAMAVIQLVHDSVAHMIANVDDVIASARAEDAITDLEHHADEQAANNDTHVFPYPVH